MRCVIKFLRMCSDVVCVVRMSQAREAGAHGGDCRMGSSPLGAGAMADIYIRFMIHIFWASWFCPFPRTVFLFCADLGGRASVRPSRGLAVSRCFVSLF